MNDYLVKINNNPNNLPDNWDTKSLCYFQTKEFLIHCHNYNPCDQSYIYTLKDNKVVSGAVLYRLKIDILNFLRIKSPIKLSICGIPASVSCSGIIGEADQNLIHEIFNYKKSGFLLFLNNYNPLKSYLLGTAKTLPTIILKNSWESFEHYQRDITSSYRRIQKNTLVKFKNVESSYVPIKNFDNEMHSLYKAVFDKSKDKLEFLSMDFFKNLPNKFKLKCFYFNNELLGWHITIVDKEYLRFFLGGINYERNSQFSIYHNILLDITKEGINNKISYIDYGQTAERAKARLGGKLEQRYMAGYNRNSIINNLIKIFLPKLGYNKKIETFNVIKGKI